MVKVIWHKTASLPQTVESYSPGDANEPSHVGTLAPPGEYDWTHPSVGPPEFTTQTANRSVQPFLHSSRHKVPKLYNGLPFPQNCYFPWGIWTPSNLWFIGAVQARNPNDITVGSAVFTHDRRVSLYFTMGRLSPSKLPILVGHLDPI